MKEAELLEEIVLLRIIEPFVINNVLLLEPAKYAPIPYSYS